MQLNEKQNKKKNKNKTRRQNDSIVLYHTRDSDRETWSSWTLSRGIESCSRERRRRRVDDDDVKTGRDRENGRFSIFPVIRSLAKYRTCLVFKSTKIRIRRWLQLHEDDDNAIFSLRVWSCRSRSDRDTEWMPPKIIGKNPNYQNTSTRRFITMRIDAQYILNNWSCSSSSLRYYWKN